MSSDTLHWSDSRLAVHKVVVGPYDNNVFVLRCKETGDAVLLDAANEHELLLELARDLGVRRVLETHGHGDHIQAVPAMREAGYEVAVTALDAPRLKEVGYDVFIDDAEVIEVGRLRLHAIHTPGHRRSICFRAEGAPLLFSGDTLFPGGPGAGTTVAISPRSSSRSTRNCSPCPPTRSCCPVTAPTPPSATSALTCRNGSIEAGEPARRHISTIAVVQLQWRCDERSAALRDRKPPRPTGRGH
jgi:hypothetical protein